MWCHRQLVACMDRAQPHYILGIRLEYDKPCTSCVSLRQLHRGWILPIALPVLWNSVLLLYYGGQLRWEVRKKEWNGFSDGHANWPWNRCNDGSCVQRGRLTHDVCRRWPTCFARHADKHISFLLFDLGRVLHRNVGFTIFCRSWRRKCHDLAHLLRLVLHRSGRMVDGAGRGALWPIRAIWLYSSNS